MQHKIPTISAFSSRAAYAHGLGTIPEILQSLRDGSRTATSLTQTLLDRIDRLNPELNMILISRREAVLEEARISNERLQSGKTSGLLEGLPVSIKDAFDTAGIETTSGTLHRRGRVPATDSTCVRQWRERGALVLAKSNTPEFGHALETTNLAIGRTLNPWSRKHTIGGSSGGEAALIASGCSLLGMGSDMCGSVRIPAHFGGICALKLGNDTVIRDGHPPFLPEYIFQLAGVGPMARTITDLSVGFLAVAGRDDQLRTLIEEPTADLWSMPPPRILVAFEDDALLTPRCKDALLMAAEALRRAGCTIKSQTPRALIEADHLWDDITRADGRKAMRAAISDHQPLVPWVEMMRNAFGVGRRHWLSFVWIYLDYFKKVPPLDVSLNLRDTLRAELLETLGNEQLLLLPVTPGPAHLAGDYSALSTMTRYVRAANVFGLPALSLPVILPDVGRLPVGVQLLGPPGSEQRLLNTGRLIELEVARAHGVIL